MRITNFLKLPKLMKKEAGESEGSKKRRAEGEGKGKFRSGRKMKTE